ncbi:dihydrodipicolinate synthase family protein [Gallaecimonas xiamenensis]|uniref:Dihydrodipicolinate synthetase n=1 Tax=Gallaecimonas xiamenensis 3-C-1 TaxID=745411 RepID=K2JN27_9GAMM|nr:dihydrodipicolinate synthase family protein [Gallaecimonas xiamenensis]EKE76648.1 dihydrodipicolinate synthetase [Gallaecimonas xiamenensis 3-C-1]
MFGTLSAFPLTPYDDGLDAQAYAGLIARLAAARVDCIGALGSTGCAPYLSLKERQEAARIAVAESQGVPVMVGISALASRDVLTLAEGAQQAGAKALLLAPVSYQPLEEDEVFGLYQAVSQASSVPVCVYENPRTTQFTFSNTLRQQLAALPQVAAFKIPGLSADTLQALRPMLPPSIQLGVAGDGFAAAALGAGADHWHSVLAGLFPEACQRLVSAINQGTDPADLGALWALFSRYGSLKVMAAAASAMGLANNSLVPPLKPLVGEAQTEIKATLMTLNLLAIS